MNRTIKAGVEVVFCIRCGRPIPCKEYNNRAIEEFPPCCGIKCITPIADWLKSGRSLPDLWFGGSERFMENGRAYWQCGTAIIKEKRFVTPLHNDFIEKGRRERNKND